VIDAISTEGQDEVFRKLGISSINDIDVYNSDDIINFLKRGTVFSNKTTNEILDNLISDLDINSLLELDRKQLMDLLIRDKDIDPAIAALWVKRKGEKNVKFKEKFIQNKQLSPVQKGIFNELTGKLSKYELNQLEKAVRILKLDKISTDTNAQNEFRGLVRDLEGIGNIDEILNRQIELKVKNKQLSREQANELLDKIKERTEWSMQYLGTILGPTWNFLVRNKWTFAKFFGTWLVGGTLICTFDTFRNLTFFGGFCPQSVGDELKTWDWKFGDCNYLDEFKDFLNSQQINSDSAICRSDIYYISPTDTEGSYRYNPVTKQFN
jgi:hypothetical protein